MNRCKKLISCSGLILLIFLFTENVFADGKWNLIDTQREIIADKGYNPAEWRGDGAGGITAYKKWRALNQSHDSIINSIFQWKGIPGSLNPNEKLNVKVSLNQLINNETGYSSFIKIYLGEVGGAEVDGPAIELGWRDGGKSVSTSGILTIPAGIKNSKPLRITVLCSVGQDKFKISYFYKFTEGAEPVRTISNWSGEWQTSFGKLRVLQLGNRIIGAFPQEGGLIEGEVNNNILIGHWMNSPTYKAPDDAGDFEFTISPDGKTFTGKWRYGSSGQWNANWNGNRAE